MIPLIVLIINLPTYNNYLISDKTIKVISYLYIILYKLLLDFIIKIKLTSIWQEKNEFEEL
jgi:hypothetical protein